MKSKITIDESILHHLVMESLGKILMNEALSSKVYHFTSIKQAFDIMRSNEMFCQSSIAGSADDFSDKYKFYISFTRSRSPQEGFGYGRSRGMSTARIELDGEKLRNNFRGKAINYWNSDSLTNKHSYMRDATTTVGYKYVPYDGKVEGEIPNNSEFVLKFPNENSPMYVNVNGKIYKKERAIPSSIQHHQENEIEDRLFTNKPFIDNIMDYVVRIDLLVNKESEQDDIKYAKRMSIHKKVVFVYDNIGDFSYQTDNTINDWLLSNDSISENPRLDMRSGGFYGIRLLTKFLEIMTIDDVGLDKKFKHAGRILDDNNLGKYKRSVIKSWDRWGTNIADAIDTMMLAAHNTSKEPTKEGQLILAFITRTMRKLGYKSFRDMYSKLTSKDDGKRNFEVDTTSKKNFTILEWNYTKYDITDPTKVDLWYVLDMKDDLRSRYMFFENIVYSMGFDGQIDKVKGGEERFMKYCKSLAHKDLTLYDLENVFGKIGMTFKQLLDMYGNIYEITQESLDYNEFLDEHINAPFKSDVEVWEQRYDYAKEMFRKT